jgi:hypothetical protein
MCCLKNEAETYEELNKTLPHPGDEVESADGMNGLVESVNILRQTARIIVEVDDEKELHEYSVSDLTILRRRKRGTSRPTMQKNTPPQKPAPAKETRELREGRENRDKKEAREGKGNREGKGGRENSREGRGNRENREPREPREGREAAETRDFREPRDTAEAREPRENVDNTARERGKKEHGKNRRDRRLDRRQDRRQNRDDQSARADSEQREIPQE